MNLDVQWERPTSAEQCWAHFVKCWVNKESIELDVLYLQSSIIFKWWPDWKKCSSILAINGEGTLLHLVNDWLDNSIQESGSVGKLFLWHQSKHQWQKCSKGLLKWIKLPNTACRKCFPFFSDNCYVNSCATNIQRGREWGLVIFKMMTTNKMVRSCHF